MSLYCLRNLGVSDTEAFLAALDDSDSAVRLAALAGLSRTAAGEPAVLRKVQGRVLGDKEPGVRRAAAAALGAIAGADRESRDVLERALADQDADLARAARAALRRLD